MDLIQHSTWMSQLLCLLWRKPAAWIMSKSTWKACFIDLMVHRNFSVYDNHSYNRMEIYILLLSLNDSLSIIKNDSYGLLFDQISLPCHIAQFSYVLILLFSVFLSWLLVQTLSLFLGKWLLSVNRWGWNPNGYGRAIRIFFTIRFKVWIVCLSWGWDGC